jgi:hypothetical protein
MSELQDILLKMKKRRAVRSKKKNKMLEEAIFVAGLKKVFAEVDEERGKLFLSSRSNVRNQHEEKHRVSRLYTARVQTLKAFALKGMK